MSDVEKLRKAVAQAIWGADIGAGGPDDVISMDVCNWQLVDKETADIFAAIYAAGFAVVPKVATETMLYFGDHRREQRDAIWAEMLAAAPKVTP